MTNTPNFTDLNAAFGEELEKYGQIWARVWPTDIVMLVEE